MNEDKMKAIGEIIKKKRLEKGLRLYELADKISIHPANLSRIEKGVKPLPKKKIAITAIILDSPEICFIAGEPVPESLQASIDLKNMNSYGFEENDYLQIHDDIVPEYQQYKPTPEISMITETDLAILRMNKKYVSSDILKINPILRKAIIEKLPTFKDRDLRLINAEKELEILQTQEEVSPSLKEITTTVIRENRNLWFFFGHILGTEEAAMILKTAIDQHGLFWFLAGFLSPEDALILDNVYAATKNSPDKTKLAEALKSYLDLLSSLE